MWVTVSACLYFCLPLPFFKSLQQSYLLSNSSLLNQLSVTAEEVRGNDLWTAKKKHDLSEDKYIPEMNRVIEKNCRSCSSESKDGSALLLGRAE